MNLQELWSQLTPAHLTAATLTPDGAMLGDEDGLLLAVDGRGEPIREKPLPAPVHDIAATEDDLVAVVSGEGEILLFEGAKTVFRKSLAIQATMISIGPHGDYLLALAPTGEGVFLNRYGREMSRFSAPAGAQSHAVVPRTGEILVVGRRGVVGGFTSWGKPLWQTELTGTTGAVSTDSRGELVLVPVTAYGVEALTAAGRHIGAYDIGEPVKAATCSGDGEALLFATTDDRLVLLRKDATVLSAESFPAPIRSVRMSADGLRALVTTASGYAHLLAVTERDGQPMLELGQSAGGSRPHYLVKKRVFSPFSILIQARLHFSRSGEMLAVAGDRRRVQAIDLSGEEIASRRWGGSLFEIVCRSDDTIRILASQSVFTFDPRKEGSSPEWTGHSELTRVARDGRDRAAAVTDDGEVLLFGPEGLDDECRFYLPTPKVADLALTPDRLVVALKDGAVVFLESGGEEVGISGPWPAPAKILAIQPCGLLLGLRKLLLLTTPDGEEVWRAYLPSPAADGMPAGAGFLVVDEAGVAHFVTSKGVVRRAFSSGKGRVVPFADAGEGPGFLVAEGDLLTAVHPDGSPRWRYRTNDTISSLAASPCGRFAAVLAGLELFVFPVLRESRTEQPGPDAVEFLEFADG